jgi:hypothetical protein
VDTINCPHGYITDQKEHCSALKIEDDAFGELHLDGEILQSSQQTDGCGYETVWVSTIRFDLVAIMLQRIWGGASQMMDQNIEHLNS